MIKLIIIINVVATLPCSFLRRAGTISFLFFWNMQHNGKWKCKMFLTYNNVRGFLSLCLFSHALLKIHNCRGTQKKFKIKRLVWLTKKSQTYQTNGLPAAKKNCFCWLTVDTRKPKRKCIFIHEVITNVCIACAHEK